MTTPQLESLYPFLHGKARDGAREREALLDDATLGVEKEPRGKVGEVLGVVLEVLGVVLEL